MHDSLNKFLPASNLKPGEHLRTPDGASVTVVGGTIPKQHDGWMWDLTVPGNNDHDFYVLPARTTGHHTLHMVPGNTPVLVHNCGDATPEELYDSATSPYGKTSVDEDGNIVRGQSNAGRALQKHADPTRGSQASLFPSLSTDAERNSVSSDMIMDLLTNPETTDTLSDASAHYGGVVRDLWHPDGWGARWSMRGGGLTFEGFLAP